MYKASVDSMLWSTRTIGYVAILKPEIRVLDNNLRDHIVFQNDFVCWGTVKNSFW